MKERKDHRIRKLSDRIGREIYIDTFESFLLQMNSSDELTVRGKAEVRLSGSEEIMLDYPDKSIQILGERLCLLVFSESEAVISGRIEKIAFLWGGG